MRKIAKITYSSRFIRAAKKLPRELRIEVIEREVTFRSNCFDPRLKTHKLTGELKGCWSFSITHSHRVLFEFLDHETVLFVDVGDHSIYE